MVYKTHFNIVRHINRCKFNNNSGYIHLPENNIYEYVVLKIINSKNAKIIYQLSFPLLVICIMALMIFKEKIVNYIFI